MRIYTLGYEGFSFRDYADILVSFGVGVVLDVRDRAWSQKPDFIKSTLDYRLATVGINYIHVRSAGNPSHIRKTAKSAEECLRRYRDHLNEHPSCIGELYSFARLAFESGRSACITCMEREPENCHRSVLVEALLAEDPKVEFVHLPLSSPVELRRPMKDTARSLYHSSFLSPLLFPSS